MASESEASCEEDPNFAVICAFFEKFGVLLGVTDIDIYELQTMLENTYEVPKFLMDLHIKLLRKIKKNVHLERWEKSIIKFGHTFSSKDAWEVERFGYKNAKLTSKVRILKELLEAQFDFNTKFKTEINKLGSTELRSQPLGRDKFGHAYWFQSDENCQIRVFKEDLDDEKWTLVARDRAGLVSLITTLSDGDIKISSDSTGNEDSNSLSEKPVIDTGQQDTDSKKTSDDEDSNLEKKSPDKDDEKLQTVLRIKNLSELMPSPKRQREEEDGDEGTIFQKYKIKNLEIRVSKIEKEPVIGEAIEEPVMKIQGEGTGEENDSPIVGETIEGEIMYVYGNGSGYDCQTGNQPGEENGKPEESSSAICETKTTEGRESISQQQSNNLLHTNESSSPKDSTSESPKKFFFGSGSSPFKGNLSTIPFGSSIKDTNNVEENSNTEKNMSDNKIVNINQSKASEEISIETVTKSKTNEMTELLEPKEKIQGSKNETDNVGKSLKDSNYKNDQIESNNIVDSKGGKTAVSEPPCNKKIAYICGKDEEYKKKTIVEDIEYVSIKPTEPIKKAETVTVEDKEDVKTDKSIATTETVQSTEAVKLTETIKSTETVKSTETAKSTETVEPTETDNSTETVKSTGTSETVGTSKTVDKADTVKKTGTVNIIASDSNQLKIKEDSQETALKKDEGNNSVEYNDLETDRDPVSNSDSVANNEKPETKKPDSDSNDKGSEVKPEVVFVSGRTRGKKQATVTAAVSVKIDRPIKKIGKGGTGMKKKSKSLDRDNDKAEEKTKVNSADSSIPNSPALSMGDNSIISVEEITAGDSCDVCVPEADPLAVSDAEGKAKTAAATGTTGSFSLDFRDSPTPVKIPIVPSPMRAVRKRGREITSLKTIEADNGPGKRMKLKGRRQVHTALRKSVEQRIEQLQGSSSESKDSETEQHPQVKKKASRSKKKSPKKGKRKNVSAEESDIKQKKASQIKRDPAKKNSRILAGLDINEESSNDRPAVRQSRRLAQLKIKEQVEPAVKSTNKVEAKKKQKSKGGDKIDKPEKRKRDKKPKEEEVSEPEVVVEVKKKKKKEKPVSQIFNENRPWQSSSEDSEEVAEEEEEEEIIEEEYVHVVDPKSDHEFSPESDLEDDGKEYQPMKRARTAKKESDEEEVDEFRCQKCGKEDHPEWILLCDKCDSGWHCSCLRPPLLVIPEGDWYCPPCQHIVLLEQLQAKLVEYDKKLTKKEVEDRRKERLAYVGISLNNVLPSKEHSEHRKKKRRHSESGSNSSSSESTSESESDSDEPIYQLRQRRQTKNYKFNEYDEMIKTAIGEDANKPEDTAGNLGRGKDIQTIVKGLEPEPEANKGEDDHERPSVTNLKKMLRKKHRKLNSLEFDSEDEDISDEDFKGSSGPSEEDDEEQEETEDSDDYLGRKRRQNLPTRRSTRARTKRYDNDFIDDSEDEPPKRKKKKSIWTETDTEDSDGSGYGPKEKKKKKKKKKRKDNSDDEPRVKKNRPRIKYGGLTSSEEEELGKGRRTRGKQTTYVDTLGSDSQEEAQTKKNPRRIESDDEDFVANEDDEVEDEEKDSDDREEQAVVEEEKDADSEQERREKRSLLVPKIYIKKPLGAKKQREFEATKVVKAPPSLPNECTAVKKLEEKAAEETKQVNTEEKQNDSNKDEEKTENSKDQKSIEIKQTAEINKTLENNKPQDAKETFKDTLSPVVLSNQIEMTESSIKKEVEEVDEKIGTLSETQQPRSVMPISESSVSLTKIPAKRGRKPKIIHEPIVSNVSALFKNDHENDDLSEPPGISLPFFDDLASNSNSSNSKEIPAPDTPKKRRGRGPGKKKTLEESLSSIGTRITPTKPTQPAIEIAAPPQPFLQAQPTPSVITRMLQSKPGITIYPVGRIRPKQFATMRDDDSDESSPRNSPSSSPVAAPMGGAPNQYNIPGGPRGPPMIGSYRPHGPHPGMNHYPRGPPGFRGPPPSQGMLPHSYSHHPSHRPMDPSPSGGGPINLADPGTGPPAGGPTAGPERNSPGRRGSLVSRYPPVRQPSPVPILTAPRLPMQQLPPQQSYPSPPTSTNGPPPSQQSYHPPSTSVNASTPQSYPPRPTSSNGPPSSQPPYHPPPISSNGPPPAQQSYSRRSTSSNGPPQPTYPAPSTTNNGPPPQQPYPPPPTNGPPPSQPPEGYYRNYTPPATEEPMPPATYQGMPPGASSPYSEQYSGEEQTPVIPPTDSSNSKVYDEESGGEFAGLASYFSSQRDDDLES